MNHLKNDYTQFLKNKKRQRAFLEFLLGCFIIAFAYNLFIAPNKLSPGGVAGLAIVINNLTGIDNAHFIFVVNIGLLVLSYIFLGKEKTYHTILGAITIPIMIEITKYWNVWIHIDNSNLLLSTMIGGLLFGTGFGFVLKGGFTTGGTDIINQILSKYIKLSVPKCMFLTDGLIVITSGIFFGAKIILYSIILLYIITNMADRIVLGTSNDKLFYIISKKEEEIKKYITKGLQNKIIILNSTGGANEKNYDIILTVIPTRNYYELKKSILEIDSEAFLMITDSYELFGGE